MSFVAAACVQVACAAPMGAPPPSGTHGDANIVLSAVSVDRLVDGRVAAFGTAAALTYVRAGGHFEATEVSAVLRPPPGEGGEAGGLPGGPAGDLTLSAPRASGELGARRARVEGGVTLRTARGDRLSTDHAEVDGAAGLIHADSPVAIEGPGYRTHAASGVARTDGTQLELRGGVEGELVPVPGPQGPR